MKMGFSIKKFVSAAMCAMLICAGCGSSSAAKSTEQTAGDVSEEEKVDRKEKIVFKLAATHGPNMVTIKALQNFSEKLKKETGGKIEVQIYPSSQLGDQTEQFEAFKLGNIEMCLMASSVVSQYIPEFIIFGFPTLFKSSEHMETFYNSEICRNILDKALNENGIKIIGLYHEGIRNIWLKDKEIHKLEDFKGIKLRVPDLKIEPSAFSLLGMDIVPMTWSECYVALQSGIVDGVENNVEMIVNSRLTDFVNYEIKTEHNYSALFLIISESAYNQMTDEQKEIFDRLVDECNKEAYENFSLGQAKANEKTAAVGIRTISLEAEAQEKMDRIFYECYADKVKGILPETTLQEIAAMNNK